jgi:hypothetical protein
MSEIPSGVTGTPQEWDAYLSHCMSGPNRLEFYQWIGAKAVTEAVADARRDLGNDPVPPEHRYYSPDSVDEFLNAIDPAWEGGPYPSELPFVSPLELPRQKDTQG